MTLDRCFASAISAAFATYYPPPKQELCMPDDVVLAEIQAAVVDFLRDSSELRDFGAAGLVKKAHALKHPCIKKL